MTRGPNVNGFTEGGGRVIVCQRECETQRHEWENERDEKLQHAGEMKRKAGERGTEKKGIDEIEDYVE